MPHSSLGHDTTALRPTTPVGRPRYIQRSTPCSSVTTRGTSSACLAATRPANMSGGSTTWSSMLTRRRSSRFTGVPSARWGWAPLLLSCPVVTVPARSAKEPAPAANIGLVDLRRGGAALGGSHLYEGDRLVTGWHSHDLHQIEYAVRGT